MLILEVYKSIVHCIGFFFVWYFNYIINTEHWFVIIIPYNQWHVSYPVPVLGAFMHQQNVSLVSASVITVQHTWNSLLKGNEYS